MASSLVAIAVANNLARFLFLSISSIRGSSLLTVMHYLDFIKVVLRKQKVILKEYETENFVCISMRNAS